MEKRIIKFRSKCGHTGEWIYGNFINSKRFTGCSNEFRIHNIETGMESDVIPETVGQFTGLIDKNGKEIFEGDLIKLTGGLRLEFYPDNGQIIFNEHSGSFVMKALNEHGVYMNFSLGYSDGTEIEVVGNIYENPNGFAEAGGKN